MNRRDFLGALSAGVVASKSTSSAQTGRRPNVVMIYCDDLGYGDLGCYGSKIPTPNLDQMATEGVRFEQFYSASAVSSPSRAALLTGRYPTRVGVPGVLSPNDEYGLSTSESTLADLLKGSGYRTMCIGKWHLGTKPQYLPTNRGFDEYYGIPYSNDMWPRVLMHNTDVVEDPVQLDTVTSRYTERAVNFITSNKDNPFFLYLPHTFPHIPLVASKQFRGKSKLGLYGDVVAELDWSVGEILNTLRANGLDQSTLVMFSSDNGPWYQGSPGPFRGRKGDTYEGGMREPFLAWMPGQIPGGQVSSTMATTLDIVPTVTRLCGAAGPANPLDGVDIWPALTGVSQDLNREVFLYFDRWDVQCARLDGWKLHMARFNTPEYMPVPPEGRINLPLPKPELYDLLSDPKEGYDVSDDYPDIGADIQARVDALLTTFPEAVQWSRRETLKRKIGWSPADAPPVPATDP